MRSLRRYRLETRKKGLKPLFGVQANIRATTRTPCSCIKCKNWVRSKIKARGKKWALDEKEQVRDYGE